MENEADVYIVDCDCGADDAMALVLAMHKHSDRILAITCSYGNTTVHNVCQNVIKTLVVCQSTSIPVFRGCEEPLLPHYKTGYEEDVHGSDGLSGCSHLYPTGGIQVDKTEKAPAALSRLAREHPGLITLVCLAPLTNVALAHRFDSQFTANLKKIVCMGGNSKGIGNITETAEFNFYTDPEAAHMIMTEARCPVALVPWETTVEYGIHWDKYEEMMNVDSAKARFLKAVTKAVADFCKDDPMFYDCDFLAMLAALYPESVKSSTRQAVAVECKGEYSRGLCVCLRKRGSKPLVEIIQDFDETFLERIRKEMLTD